MLFSLGIVHIRAVEEVGIGRPRHERGDGYAPFNSLRSPSEKECRNALEAE